MTVFKQYISKTGVTQINNFNITVNEVTIDKIIVAEITLPELAVCKSAAEKLLITKIKPIMIYIRKSFILM
nr:hypothetical protein [Dyadobacter sp. CECT 9623]